MVDSIMNTRIPPVMTRLDPSKYRAMESNRTHIFVVHDTNLHIFEWDTLKHHQSIDLTGLGIDASVIDRIILANVRSTGRYAAEIFERRARHLVVRSLDRRYDEKLYHQSNAHLADADFVIYERYSDEFDAAGLISDTHGRLCLRRIIRYGDIQRVVNHPLDIVVPNGVAYFCLFSSNGFIILTNDRYMMYIEILVTHCSGLPEVFLSVPLPDFISGCYGVKHPGWIMFSSTTDGCMYVSPRFNPSDASTIPWPQFCRVPIEDKPDYAIPSNVDGSFLLACKNFGFRLFRSIALISKRDYWSGPFVYAPLPHPRYFLPGIVFDDENHLDGSILFSSPHKQKITCYTPDEWNRFDMRAMISVRSLGASKKLTEQCMLPDGSLVLCDYAKDDAPWWIVPRLRAGTAPLDDKNAFFRAPMASLVFSRQYFLSTIVDAGIYRVENHKPTLVARIPQKFIENFYRTDRIAMNSFYVAWGEYAVTSRIYCVKTQSLYKLDAYWNWHQILFDDRGRLLLLSASGLSVLALSMDHRMNLCYHEIYSYQPPAVDMVSYRIDPSLRFIDCKKGRQALPCFDSWNPSIHRFACECIRTDVKLLCEIYALEETILTMLPKELLYFLFDVLAHAYDKTPFDLIENYQ